MYMASKRDAEQPITQQNNSKYLPWIVWSLSSIFYFYEFLLQVSPGVMSSELMHDFSVTSETLGILSGIYFYSYAAMQLPGGILMDHFGPRRLLTLATTICALSTIAFGLTDHFYMACLARLMIGFGSSFACVGTMKIAANWFPASRFAFLTGILVTIGMMGAIGGEAPLALLVDDVGWRDSMLFMGGAGLIITILMHIIIKDSPIVYKKLHTNQGSVTEEPLWPSLRTLLKNRQLWLIAIYGGLIYMTTPVFCGLWGVPFLMLKLHLTKAAAANYISLVFIGWAVASPVWGIFSSRIGRRKPPLYISAIGSIITSLLFIYAPLHSGLVLQVLLFAFGVCSAAFLPAFAVAKELCNSRYVATGLSFMNMMNMLGVALAQPLIGYILDRLWQGTIANHIRIYPLSAYYAALSILPIGMLVALLILPKVRETYCTALDDIS